MKNMLELPKGEDYHETTTVETTQKRSRYGCHKKEDALIYKKGIINMRNIVDVSEFKLSLTVIDEEKFKKFEKEVLEFESKQSSPQPVAILGGPRTFRIGPEFMDEVGGDFPLPPELPTEDFDFKGTAVLYVNGMQRVLVDDYDDFKELYFNYLNRQKLDI